MQLMHQGLAEQHRRPVLNEVLNEVETSAASNWSNHFQHASLILLVVSWM